jgi:hypothetical protein
MGKITVSDLYNWMDEYEEDPIVDGPIYLTAEDEEEFLESLDKNIIDEDNFDFLAIGGGGFSEKEEEYLVNLWVDFLNEKGYPNDYLFD